MLWRSNINVDGNSPRHFNFSFEGVTVQLRIPSIKRKESLPECMRAVQEASIEQVLTNPQNMLTRYIHKNRNVVGADEARELFAEYRSDRTASEAVHAASKVMTSLAYDALLEFSKQSGNNTVLFTSGGNGAGKTSALDIVGGAQEYAIVYDGSLSGNTSAKDKIDRALRKGFNVHIFYVYNDIMTAFTNVLMRSEEEICVHGSGRVVPIHVHLDTHTGALKTIPFILEHYKSDPRVSVTIIDNTGNNRRVVTDHTGFLCEKEAVVVSVYYEKLLTQHAIELYENKIISQTTLNALLMHIA